MGKTSKSRHDTAVQGTNDNSIVSKASCAAHEYVHDEFVTHFAAKHPNRSPLINRSYYIRYMAVECVISSFLQTFQGRKTQILNLGAGFDALYFNLKTRDRLKNTTYIEVDYADVAERKAALITNTPQLNSHMDLCQRPYKEGVKKITNLVCTVLQSSDYIAVGADLTKLPVLERILCGLGIDYNTPTLLMSEVVLTYLPAEKSTAVIGWAAERFTHAVFWSYEQIKPYDGFGQVMMKHFTKMGSPLLSISTYPTIQHQINRHCVQLGWEECIAVDLNYLFHHYLSREERDRVASLQPFDEWEEWTLASGHYMVMTAARGNGRGVISEIREKLNMRRREETEEGQEKAWQSTNGDGENVISETMGKLNMNRREEEEERQEKTGQDNMKMTGPKGGGENVISKKIGKKNMEKKEKVEQELVDETTRSVDQMKMDKDKTDTPVKSVIKDYSSIYGHAYLAKRHVKDTSCMKSGDSSTNTSELCENEPEDTNTTSKHCENQPKDTSTTSELCENQPKETNTTTKHCENQPMDDTTLNLTPCSLIDQSDIVHFHRFGQAGCQIGSKFFLVGGFGERKSGHSRMKDLLVFDTHPNTDMAAAVQIYSGFSSLERVFGTVTALPDGALLVFGGRLSPTKPCLDMVLLEETTDGWREEVREVPEKKLLRWRHTANVLNLAGEPHVVIYGGCGVEETALGDCWAYNIASAQWKQVEVDATLREPCARHSHAAVGMGAGSGAGAGAGTGAGAELLVACGLGEDATPLADVWRLCLSPDPDAQAVWQEVKVQGSLQPRFSHTADVLAERLFLLGGVASTEHQPGLTLIHLITGVLTDFPLPDRSPAPSLSTSPVLLYGHQVAFTDDSRRRLVVIGGGGNCFSFGTHFNDPQTIDMDQLLEAI